MLRRQPLNAVDKVMRLRVCILVLHSGKIYRLSGRPYAMRRGVINLILGSFLSLGGLISCQTAPMQSPSTYGASPEFAFRQFILHYYRNEEARLRDKYGDKSIVRDTGWNVRVTVKQISMTNSTHGVVCIP